MWHSILHLLLSILQESRPHHDTSQQDTWWGSWTCDQELHPHTSAWRPQNLHRLRRLKREGQNPWVPFNIRRRFEGGYTHQRPMDSGEGCYSWHACHEYWRHLLPVLKTLEVPGNFWGVEEKELSWRLPQTVSALHSTCCISEQPYQCRGRGNTEIYFQPHWDKVEGTLITDLQVREE